MNNYYKLFIFIFAILFFQSPVRAEFQNLATTTIATTTVENKFFNINLDVATIVKGYTVTAFNDDIKLSLVPGILSSSTKVEVVELNEKMEMPWQLDKISEIYQFEFKNKASYDNNKPFYIQIAYQDNDSYKQVFFYDKNFASWRPLPTKDYPDENFVRSIIHLPYARLAVFAHPKTLTNGKASWYAYKPGNFAASPDYPKGSILRVHNKDNNKFVDVVVNDYGPDRSIFPDRVIDLEKNAFASLASLGEGTIDVLIEPLLIKESEDSAVLNVDDNGINNKTSADVKAAVVINAENNKIIWSKNENEILPLASLTKIVAIKVFLEKNPEIDLKKVVAYDSQDKEYNYEFCERKYSISSLRITDKATLTIKDLIYSSLVGSANNTVETLVRISGLKRTDFIDEMNKLVKEWGASSTHFIDPTGLSPKNLTTARDYAIISKNALADPIIKDASVTKLYEFYTSDSEQIHKIRNTNNLIRYNKMDNISGSKTGYLIEAGFCLMTRAEKENGESIIVVTLGAKSRETSINETQKLLNYGLRS